MKTNWIVCFIRRFVRCRALFRRYKSQSLGPVTLATRLGPLRRFVLAHTWDVDVEGAPVLLERSPEGGAEAGPSTQAYSLVFLRHRFYGSGTTRAVSMTVCLIGEPIEPRPCRAGRW